MSKGNQPGPFNEQNTGPGDGQIPQPARDRPFGHVQRQAARAAGRRGQALPAPDTPIIRTIGSPGGSQMLERWLQGVMRSFQQHVRLPSHQYIPFRGTTIDSIGTTTVAASATGTIVTFAIPRDHRGVILGFGHDVDDVNAWDDLTWSLRVNNQSKDPYSALTHQIGTVLNPSRLAVIHVQPGRTVGVYAVNGAGNPTHAVRARMVGWYYPLRANRGGFAETLTE